MSGLRWVCQEHANGCALAVAAMITGKTYAEMHALVSTFPGYEDRNWETSGVSHYEVDRLIAHHGWFIQRWFVAYRERQPWPPAPWADLHYAMVVQPSGNTHFVVMDRDGRVLDPLREGFYSLADWEKVNQVIAVCRPAITGNPDRARRGGATAALHD